MRNGAYSIMMLLMMVCGCQEKTVDFQDPNVFALTLETTKFNGGIYDATYVASANSFSCNFYLSNNNERVSFVVTSPTVLKPYTTYLLGMDTVNNTNLQMTYHTGLVQYNAYAGKLSITRVDTVNRYIWGTFNFNAGNLSGDPVHITNGYFENAQYIQK